MNSSRRQALIGLCGLPVSAVLGRLVFAQQTPLPAPPKPLAVDVAAANDAPLAACLLIDGRRQIGKCELVRKRLHTEEARIFAQAEIDEHLQIASQLKQLGFTYPVLGDQHVANPVRPAAPGTVVAEITPAATLVNVGKGKLLPGAAEMIKMQHEVVDQCLATFKALVERKEGLKLDKCFVGDQLHAHYGLWDSALVFKKHSSPEVKLVLEEGLLIIQKHIATLEDLMERLELAKG